jgi:hypothetical protein
MSGIKMRLQSSYYRVYSLIMGGGRCAYGRVASRILGFLYDYHSDVN